MKVQHLSLYGLLMQCLGQGNPITAQVLLFYHQSLTKLNIHLLPENVPVEEVQRKHKSITYVTSFSCQLTPGKKYKACCKTDDCHYVFQPEDEWFKCDYGINFHPTFEVFFNSDVKNVTFSLLEENGQVALKPRDVLLPVPETSDTSRASTSKDSPDPQPQTQQVHPAGRMIQLLLPSTYMKPVPAEFRTVYHRFHVSSDP
ncbi:uncharacterized protein LOC132841216 [Tachysurus vachellii]|uniref:uncharacterized protein LOC132841216 n=1 Tax=Tachysurus vachellii TaxID=175792 RepID=UPI00296AD8B6|nr:uncharacterized protein LOC132841216 [Tachysurus vachellii]